MSVFTDQLATDVADTFCNAEEFGRDITWNGETVQATVEDLGTREGDDMGVNRHEMLVFILTKDIEEPVIGEEIRVNGERWYVNDVFDADGGLEITLFQEVS